MGAERRDVHYFQEKLILIRCSIEYFATLPAVGNDSLSPIEEGYGCVSNIVRLCVDLFQNASMEPTTGRVYRTLTAGLSLLLTIVIVLCAQDPVKRDLHSQTWLEEGVSVLELCRDTLESMSRSSPGSRRL